jgi:cell division protein FtsB
MYWLRKSGQMTLNIIMVTLLWFFAMQLTSTDRGLASIGPINKKINIAQADLNRLKIEEAYLRQKNALLSSDAIDPDILGELARKKNGLYGDDEVVIFIK